MNEKVLEKVKNFRDDRNWKQFHNAKDLSIALNIESSELLELFLWKDSNEANIQKVKEELADIFSYAYLIAENYDFNIEDIILDKIELNSNKYPISKSKGIGSGHISV